MEIISQESAGTNLRGQTLRVKGSDTSVYVLLYMCDRGESEVTGPAAVCAADCAADLVYYAADDGIHI